MCGIAGYYSFKEAVVPSRDDLENMVSAIRHRGPDAAGIYIDDKVGLGHARLSIIDLSGGDQPVHNEDGSLWIIYNGEIFNYPELRDDLVARGHRFYTSSDTEVILHLFEEEGPPGLSRMNGQFALAIWDAVKGELFLARDRIGIRPLHYMVDNERVLFASEIKSLFQVRDVPRRIDPVSMEQIFTFWTTLPGRTVFQGVFELEPGHCMTVSSKGISIRKYWGLSFAAPSEQEDLDPERLKNAVGELLFDAVRIRLRADVPVGCYMSGGLDSSGIAATVKRRFDNKLRTFGIRFEEEQFDEGRFQDRMVSFLGTDHTAISATNAGIGESFRDVVWHCEKPILRTAPVPLYLLSAAVRENGFKVVLTGEGADEVFGGYDIFKEALIRNFWARQPGSRIRPLLIGKLYPDVFRDPRIRKSLHAFFANGLDRTGDPFFSHRIRWENTGRIKTFFSEDLRAELSGYNGLEELEGRLPEGYGRWDLLSRAQYLEIVLFLSNYLLSSQGDRVAMAHSVEIRLPFLDYRLVEFMGRVPSKWKINGLQEKHLLKMVLKDMLPGEIVKRPKHPYRAPIRQSLHGAVNEDLTELLSDRTVRRAGLFDPRKVETFRRKIRNSSRTSEVDSMALAGILSAHMVHDMFVSRFETRNPPRYAPGIVVDRRTNPAGA